MAVLSSACQDGVCRPAQISFNRKARTLSVEFNRFVWERAGRRPPWLRRRSALSFSGVLSVQSLRLPRDTDSVLSILALVFVPSDPPGGIVTVLFAGGAELRLTTEHLEAMLMDSDVEWSTPRRPDHDRAR